MIEKEKLLLICPHFMGYDEKIILCLSENYKVEFVDSESFLAKIRSDYKKKSKIKRAFLKTFKGFRSICRENMLKSVDYRYYELFSDIKNYDIIFVINGDAMSDNVYYFLKNQNKSAKFVIYIWDDFKGLFQSNKLKHFDEVLSYNIEDCDRYGFKYLPMFTQKSGRYDSNKRKYDISIIATANEERVKVAKQLFNKYKNIYQFYIYFYSPNEKYDFYSHTVPLSFEEYMDVLGNSKAVLEIVRHNQAGPTTRMFDALESKTKVITTNRHIVNYPVYSKNILIIDNNYSIPSDFIGEDYDDTEYNPIYISEWIDVIFGND